MGAGVPTYRLHVLVLRVEGCHVNLRRHVCAPDKKPVSRPIIAKSRRSCGKGNGVTEGVPINNPLSRGSLPAVHAHFLRAAALAARAGRDAVIRADSRLCPAGAKVPQRQRFEALHMVRPRLSA